MNIKKRPNLIYTHKKLTELSKHWLINSKQCNPVFTEQGSANFSEMPDAIGFKSDICIVVECKTSKSDLVADRKKKCRQYGGLGNLRYYFMEENLYKKCRGFDFHGWGVVVIKSNLNQGRQVSGMNSIEFDSNIKNERDFLRSRVLEIQKFGN